MLFALAADKDIHYRLANAEMADAVPSPVACVSGLESVKCAMIERVAHREEHFVHLRQRDEPDISLDERLEIVEKLLGHNPGEFLARFGSILIEEDLSYFDAVCLSDYTVHFRTTEIRQKLNNSGGKVQRAAIKNRR